MMLWIVVAVLCSAVSYMTCNPVKPCNHDDEKCLQKIRDNLYSKVSYSKIISGDPEHGIESLDPIHHDFIEGKWSILKYNFNNSITTGLKDCKTENLKLAPRLVSAQFDLICPKLDMNGKYEIDGRLIVLPVQGKGDYRISSNKYRISIETDLKVAPGKDGKNYISLKNFKHTSEPLGSVEFDFKNLFNGQKDLADAVLKFANEHWLEVAIEFQGPLFTAHCKKIVKNINKILKNLPLEELEA